MRQTTTPGNSPLPHGEGSSGARQRLVTLLSILPWAAILFLLLFVLPRYEQRFRQFNFKPDDVAAFLFRVSDWARAHVLAAFLIVFALMIANVVISAIVQSAKISGRKRRMLMLLVFGIPTLLFVLTWVGAEITRRTLIDDLQH